MAAPLTRLRMWQTALCKSPLHLLSLGLECFPPVVNILGIQQPGKKGRTLQTGNGTSKDTVVEVSGKHMRKGLGVLGRLVSREASVVGCGVSGEI